MSEKYNSSKRPRRFTEEIMSICLCYWRHYVSRFYGASLNSMFKIHFKKVAKYLLCGTEPLMTQFFHILYARWKRKILAIMGNFMSLFYSDLSVHTCISGQKFSEDSAKSMAEHRNFPFSKKKVFRSLQNGWIFLTKTESTAWHWWCSLTGITYLILSPRSPDLLLSIRGFRWNS